MISAGHRIAPRSSVFVRNTVHAFLLSELCSREATTVKMTYTRERSKREFTVTLVNLPYDSDEPPLSKG